jgi:hypothetical protein
MVTLLHNKFKIPGIIMAAAGIILAAMYFIFNFRFELPVFAVFSSYMKTNYFTTFKTNFTDETIMVLLLLGFSLWVFSKEKQESKALWVLRVKALKKAALTDIGILLFTVLFIYGSGFVAIVLLNMILPFVLYLSYFYYLKNRERRKAKA